MYLFSKEKNNVVCFPRQIADDIKFETNCRGLIFEVGLNRQQKDSGCIIIHRRKRLLCRLGITEILGKLKISL